MKERVVVKIVLALLFCSPGWSAAYARVKCTPDMVQSGPTCMDKYEASVWRIPNPLDANKGLVKKVQNGKVTIDDLTAGGATRLNDNYAPCENDGRNCLHEVYAVSIVGVQPSELITWFQAQQACKNSQKRLPTNAEWQAAAAGTPGEVDCGSGSFTAGLTGGRSGCFSADGAYDMAGNVLEWVADWMPLSTACPGWGSFSNDSQCFAGADTTSTAGPGALVRGGRFSGGFSVGPLNVGTVRVTAEAFDIGFRCAR